MSALIAYFPSGGNPPRRVSDVERRRAQKMIRLCRHNEMAASEVEKLIEKLFKQIAADKNDGAV